MSEQAQQWEIIMSVNAPEEVNEKYYCLPHIIVHYNTALWWWMAHTYCKMGGLPLCRCADWKKRHKNPELPSQVSEPKPTY